jgi:hypothetical protein
MQFSVADLKAAVEAEISAARTEHERVHVERVAKFHAAEDEWVQEHGQAWLDVLSKLRAQLRRGKPLYWDDLPGRGQSRHLVMGNSRQVPTLGEYRVPYELSNLLLVLGAISDEYVTTAGLSKVGISPSALRQALSRLGRLNKAVD